MRLGYQRPLQATDLWKVDPSRESDGLSTRFLDNLEKRQKAADEWNANLTTARVPRRTRMKWRVAALKTKLVPDVAKFATEKLPSSAGEKPASNDSDSMPHTTYAGRMRAYEAEWRAHSGKKRGSITWALNDTFPNFWWGGIFKVLGDASQMMGPLVVKSIINFSKDMYAANHSNGEKPQPNIGRGVGMAIGLFFLTIMQSLCQHQFFFRSMQTGALARAALISAAYKRGINLSIRARSEHSNGKLMAYLSSDVSNGWRGRSSYHHPSGTVAPLLK
jgi:hypothetical protein